MHMRDVGAGFMTVIGFVLFVPVAVMFLFGWPIGVASEALCRVCHCAKRR